MPELSIMMDKKKAALSGPFPPNMLALVQAESPVTDGTEACQFRRDKSELETPPPQGSSSAFPLYRVSGHRNRLLVSTAFPMKVKISLTDFIINNLYASTPAVLHLATVGSDFPRPDPQSFLRSGLLLSSYCLTIFLFFMLFMRSGLKWLWTSKTVVATPGSS